jgi:hypothetical protein
VNGISGAFRLNLLPRRGLTLDSDFCFFAPPKPNSTIADTEALEVAWCTKKGHGTRGILPGTITGLQVLVNSNYIQYVAHIDQTKVNVAAGDFGGELDSGGQDGVRILGASWL